MNRGDNQTGIPQVKLAVFRDLFLERPICACRQRFESAASFQSRPTKRDRRQPSDCRGVLIGVLAVLVEQCRRAGHVDQRIQKHRLYLRSDPVFVVSVIIVEDYAQIGAAQLYAPI